MKKEKLVRFFEGKIERMKRELETIKNKNQEDFNIEETKKLASDLMKDEFNPEEIERIMKIIESIPHREEKLKEDIKILEAYQERIKGSN